MSDDQVNTVLLNGWVERMRAGDLAARDDLLRQVGDRLERLARKMLQGFPSVKRWAETGDVLQNALMRLLRALEQVRPNSVRDFFGLAAEQMRRELLDLTRRFQGPEGLAAHHHSGAGAADGPTPEPPDQAEPAQDLDRWAAFHQGVEKLPAQEREIVGLIYYHGWTQQAVADLFQINVRTVQRRWEADLLALKKTLE